MTTTTAAAPVAALWAAALFEACEAPTAVPALSESLALLSQSIGDGALRFEIVDDRLLVNGIQLAPDAPGSAAVRTSLTNHHTFRLALPPSLTATQWQALIELYASAAGLYASLDDVRDVLRATVPDVIVAGASAPSGSVDLREALFELPGLRAASNAMTPTVPPRDPRAIEHTALRAQYDGVLAQIRIVRRREDHAGFARALLELAEIEHQSDEDIRDTLVRERRRVVTSDALEDAAHNMARSSDGPLLARALAATGRDGAEALITALQGAATPAQRRLYVDALTDCRDCDEAVLGALNSPLAQVNRDAAEIAGRKRIPAAVPLLAQLLKHREVAVRTAAWHALELIGTREAVRALRS
jgi:hypothetical protein